MIIKSRGYELNFITIKRIRDSTHLFTFIYKFYSPLTKLHYIVNADYHKEDVFAIKFYAKIHKKSEFKYSKIINKGDLINILLTAAKVIPVLHLKYTTASFAFSGARSIDLHSKKVENYQLNQRFRVYRGLITKVFGSGKFTNFQYEEISAYMLVNNCSSDINEKEREIVKMFTETYNELPDIGVVC